MREKKNLMTFMDQWWEDFDFEIRFVLASYLNITIHFNISVIITVITQ